MNSSIGIVEFSSIAKGMLATDAMLKAAAVDLIMARTICPGKYIALIGGDVAAVQASAETGVSIGAEAVVDHIILASVHPAVFPAITATAEVRKRGALGIIESFSVASLVEAADACAKAAAVELIEIRIAMALGGKAFVTMTGEVGAVDAAVEVGASLIAARGALVNKAVIPSPREELMADIV